MFIGDLRTVISMQEYSKPNMKNVGKSYIEKQTYVTSISRYVIFKLNPLLSCLVCP